MTADISKALLLSSRAALIRFMRARGAQPDEAEDLVQELYLAVDTRTIGSLADPQAYLFRMANNLLLDRRREALRRTRREVAAAAAVATGNAVPAEDALIAREELAHIRDALDVLPDRTRDIFRRFRLDGDRQKQIALDLGISVSAVEKHLQQAYRALLAAREAFEAAHRPEEGGRFNVH